MKQRIIPFVDHEIGYRLLEKLITFVSAGRIEMPAVVTTLENGSMWWPGVKEICDKSNIPLLIYQSSLAESNLMRGVDWYLLLSWKYIIPLGLIKLPSRGVLNLHYSLLPAYRGVYPVNWAIIEGRRTTGITYHFVNERIDDGEIFMQVEVPVLLSDTARSLQSKLDNAAFDHFDEFLGKLLTSKLNHRIENISNNEKGISDYYSRRKFEKACVIDLDRYYRGFELFNLLRGLTFFSNSNNSYIVDKSTGRKIYVSVTLRDE